MRPIAVLEAPSNLGLRPPRPGASPGTARLADSMRERGLRERVDAEDAGRVEPPPYEPDPDPETWFRNGQGLLAFTPTLADRVAPLVRSGRFALVLGGDCSVLIGCMLGLRSMGRYGLLFLDAHDDFSPARELEKYRGFLAAAGLDLGIVTGRAPGGLNDLRGLRPYVREEDVVMFGHSPDPADSEFFATEAIESTAIHRMTVQRVRELGAEHAAREALALLARRPLDGFWIHLDADVLDQTLMPAVDSPNPAGLDFEQLGAALRVFLSDPKVVGMDLTIYDPELDPDGAYGDRLMETVARAFEPRAMAAPDRAIPETS